MMRIGPAHHCLYMYMYIEHTQWLLQTQRERERERQTHRHVTMDTKTLNDINEVDID